MMDLVSLTGDARMGFYLMLAAIISAGILYGLQLSKDRGNFRFPMEMSISIFVYYVGVLMYTPTSLPQFMLVGLYAYFTYAIVTVIAGCVITAITIPIWTLFFRTGIGASLSFSRMFHASIQRFNMLVDWYHKKYIARGHLRNVA